MSAPSAAAVIPARWASSRFPGKPLAEICGKPMIQWVVERSQRAGVLSRVIVATDDVRIRDAVHAFGGEAVMTPSDLASGTDRVAHVAEKLDAEIVVNIQGDEPLIQPEAIEQLVFTLANDDEADMATLARTVEDPAELDNLDTARVVLDARSRALYFSRAVIPHVRDVDDRTQWPALFSFYDQIGIYAYWRDRLLQFRQLPPSNLERAEKLEQLRALEQGWKIKVAVGPFFAFSVDIPDHIAWVENRMREAGLLEE